MPFSITSSCSARTAVMLLLVAAASLSFVHSYPAVDCGSERESCGAFGSATQAAPLLQSATHTSLGQVPAMMDVQAGQPAEEELGKNDSLYDDFLENKSAPLEEKPGHFPELEEEAEAEEHEHSEGHVVFVFLLIMLALGVASTFILERYIPFLPYTSVLFVEGFIVAMIQPYLSNKDLNISIALWERADPHLLMFVFLPPLVFAEAMQLNTTLLNRCFWQCMMLAVPGVIIGAMLIGAFGKYCLPYGWDWPTAMLFGSILSATDPVAVVAIFNSLGVSPRLTMLVSGESLFNDGTAILLFRFCSKMAAGVTLTTSDCLRFLFRMTTVGPIFGAILGACAVWFFGLSAGQNYPGDVMTQVVVTLFCAYTAFFVAEKELDSSGVLTMVTTGYIVASRAWPRFIDRETVHRIWHMIDFTGNTVIFVLAGLIFGGIVHDGYVNSILGWKDFAELLALYVACTVARMVMLGVLWLPLQMSGKSVSYGEGSVIVWAGMRGAVGLLMAIIADRNPATTKETGTRIMFLVGGTAALMLVANGPLMPLVLRMTGLMRTSKEEEAMLEKERYQLSTFTQQRLEFYKNSEDTKELFDTAVQDRVEGMMPLMHVDRMKSSKTLGEEVSIGRTALLRGALLRAVKAEYWKMLDDGIIGKKSRVTKVLMDSTDLGLMQESEKLSDWDAVATHLNLGKFKSQEDLDKYIYSLESILSLDIVECMDHAKSPKGFFEEYQERCIMASIAFIHAHSKSMEEVVSFLGAGDAESSKEMTQLEDEAEDQIKQARKFLKGMPVEMVSMVKSKMLAAKLLHDQATQVGELGETGVITNAHQNTLEEEIHAASREAGTLTFSQLQEDAQWVVNPLAGAVVNWSRRYSSEGSPLGVSVPGLHRKESAN